MDFNPPLMLDGIKRLIFYPQPITPPRLVDSPVNDRKPPAPRGNKGPAPFVKHMTVGDLI